ncbi:MAG: phosphatidylserine decarboxylase family protein [Bacteroidales bacterium]|nr:phosphatidylserine decarboxylase family protein [Bacteroidales bacterium]MCL2132817.1 phosphatidylserine decarboxylase family protein [Bacteroidales bacterium]
MIKIHREGQYILNFTAVLFLIIAAAVRWFCGVGWPLWSVMIGLLILYLFVLCFFRVPKRIPVLDDNAVIAPADGTIVIVKETEENEFFKDKRLQVSIFMSVFNVHINWFPIDGIVEYFRHHQGKYLVAYREKSSEDNERTTIVVNHNGVRVLFRQIAGLIARRIVCYAKEGQSAQQGTEFGFIKFGSRVDIFLPLGTTINVKEGDKVKGRQTVIAIL